MNTPQKKSAKERKRARTRAENLRASPARAFLALLREVENWMSREPREAFNPRCLGCGKDIFVTYEEGRMQHAHVEPACEAYRLLEKIVGTDVRDRKDPNAPLPAWAEGAKRELHWQEGVSLVDGGEVGTSCVAAYGMPDGSMRQRMIARTPHGLYWWWMELSPGYDGERQAEGSR